MWGDFDSRHKRPKTQYHTGRFRNGQWEPRYPSYTDYDPPPQRDTTISDIPRAVYRMDNIPNGPWRYECPKAIWWLYILPHLTPFDKARLRRTCWSLWILLFSDPQIRYCKSIHLKDEKIHQRIETQPLGNPSFENVELPFCMTKLANYYKDQIVIKSLKSRHPQIPTHHTRPIWCHNCQSYRCTCGCTNTPRVW